MGIWKTLRAMAGLDNQESPTAGNAKSSRTCHFEVMEPRRVLTANPLMVGAVYIEDDSGTDSAGDTFYVAFEGGSSTTTLSRLVIDGNQDGDATQLSAPDVYFDTDGSNQNGQGNGSGGAHPFVFSNKSIGVSASDVTVSVVDGGTRLILDFKDFQAGDILVFTIDVDQFFGNKPDDQVTSGVEFAGSSLSAVFADPHYDFASNGGAADGIFQYNFAFGSDDVTDTGVLSMLPTQDFREASNGNASIENRTAGALEQYTLTPKPVSISGHVWHDRDLDLKIDSGEEMISNVTLRLQMRDSQGNYVDVMRGGSPVTTQTNANGYYEFGVNLGLQPGTYRVLETQPTDYAFSVGEVPGKVAGAPVGTSSENVLAEITIPLGDQHAINYDFAEAKAAQLCGYVYHDRNNNGLREFGEEGIQGVELLITPISTIGPQSAITVFTDADGMYCVDGLSPGEYTVTEVVQPAGFVDGLDTPGTVNGIPVGTVVNPGDKLSAIKLGSDDTGIEYNFGELKYGSISGHVKIKTPEGNCVAYGHPDYRPIQGVIIELLDSSGNVIRTTTTDAEGRYSFGDLPMGTYGINEVMPAGFPYLQGTTAAGTIDGATVGLVNGDTITQIVLGAGQNGVNYDFCEPLPSSISGYVYHDLDNDGLKELGEPPIKDTIIELYDAAGNKVGQTTTDGTGYYVFEDLYRGTYTVVERQPSGWIDGKDTTGTISGVVKGIAGQDRISSIALLHGENGINYNFGELLAGSIAGRVISDIDGDCELDVHLGETPLSGVLIELRDASGNVIRTMRTNADGRYQFNDLMPGTYTVFEHQPSGYFDSGDHIGIVQGTGVAGPGVKSANDTLSSITLTSGMRLVEYDFCEVPGASLSGYVYQDGAVIASITSQLTPAEILAVRDGQFTSDDTPLRGVVLELRNGITGEPIMASQAAPGVYASGPIRTTTDAKGFYIFTGLPAGNYAVFQIQPNGYTDHVDSPGTTLGIAINPAMGIDPLALSTLSAGINPNNDAILRIALGVGQQSQLNNFSEVRIETPPPPPPEIPPGTPPEFFVTELPPDRFPGLYGQERVDVDPLIRFKVFDPGNAYTWHLSVINGGIPRGNQDPLNVVDPRWESASVLNREKWLSADLTRGEWTLGNADNTDGTTAEIVRRMTFGLEDGIPVTGDFNGDGVDEVAVFQAGDWYIDLNGNGRWDQDDLWAQLGSAADRPVTGDWDGDGKDDIGIYGPIWPRDPRAIEVDPGLPDPDNPRVRDPKNVPPRPEDATSGARALKLTVDGKEREDLIDHVFAYGQPQDIPVAGDWNGDGIRTIGVFREGIWELDLDGDGRWTGTDGSFSFGQAGDLPVIGDWNGDGIEEIGIFRNGTWILDIDGDRELTAADKVFEMGGAGDLPIAGDWNGDGIDDPGLYRPQTTPAGALPSLLRDAG